MTYRELPLYGDEALPENLIPPSIGKRLLRFALDFLKSSITQDASSKAENSDIVSLGMGARSKDAGTWWK